jgi:UTP--glucose-1-phosphate uridylyltransferase
LKTDHSPPLGGSRQLDRLPLNQARAGSGHHSRLQAADPAAPALPLIVNRETVDPRDPASTPVIQLEWAMGAAIGSIPGAGALHVPRSRFAPVKTTDDLLVVRSDAYELTGDGRMRPSFDRPGPVVTLDKDFYKLLPDFEQRFPAGAPSLRRCRRFVVEATSTSARVSWPRATCV